MSPRAIDLDESGNMILVEGIPFAPDPPELAVANLQPGDVLVWYSACSSRISAAIREASGGPYSHAGIYIGDGMSVDSGPDGVHQCHVTDLQEAFAYGRVMRYPKLGPGREAQVVGAAVAAAQVRKGYAWWDAITLPLRRAAFFARHKPWWNWPLLAFPGALLLRMRKMPDPVQAPTTFCSRMVLEAYFAAGMFHEQDLQECVWTPNDLASGGGFEYVGWLNHVAPAIPAWHPMDPYSPEPIRNSTARWKRSFLRILTGSAEHE